MRGTVIICAVLAVLGSQIAVAQKPNSCALPSGLREKITNKYPKAHVVSAADLGEDDEKQFQQDHGLECPGLTNVNFYGDEKPTLAVVLLSEGGIRGAETQLIVAHEIQNGWELRSLAQHINDTPVIWHERPGKYDDVYGEKTIKAKNPVIVLWGSYGSWAIVYAWIGNRVEKIWIRD
jgi:hypothetical protein